MTPGRTLHVKHKSRQTPETIHAARPNRPCPPGWPPTIRLGQSIRLRCARPSVCFPSFVSNCRSSSLGFVFQLFLTLSFFPFQTLAISLMSCLQPLSLVKSSRVSLGVAALGQLLSARKFPCAVRGSSRLLPLCSRIPTTIHDTHVFLSGRMVRMVNVTLKALDYTSRFLRATLAIHLYTS